jgi:single-strand DNA-binding protein
MNGITAAFTGRIGRDPELKYTMSGKRMLSFSVAVDENSRQTEERPEPAETTWVKVTAWEETAERLEQEGRVKKGAAVYCEGRLKLSKWMSAQGEPRSGLELSAWVVQVMGNLGERRRPRTADVLEGAPF